jgi:MYXO-CTERM domain-containing protein
MKSLVLFTSALVLLAPSIADAHVVMTSPTPRSGDNGLTMEPCGGVAAGMAQPLTAGDTITVEWEVGQSHDGTITIDFAEADDMGFRSHVLAMDLPDPGGAGSAEVELPNLDCAACTLRVIQVNPNEANYVSCADVELTGAVAATTDGDGTGGGGDSTGGGGDTTGGGGESSGGPGGSTGGGDSASASASAGETSAASAGTVGDGDSTGAPADGGDGDDGGCSCRTQPSSGAAWMLGGLFLLGLGWRRR